MCRRSLLVYSLICGAILQACKSEPAQIEKTEIGNAIPVATEAPLQPENDTQIFLDGKVEFKGVSFTYNPHTFGKIEAQVFAEAPYKDVNDKDTYVHPQYRSFQLYDAKQNNKGYLAIYPVMDFRKMYRISEEAVKNIDRDTVELQRIIKNKNLRSGKNIPVLQSFDGSEELLSKVKNVSFQNGKGVFFVTHWSYESALISNENLSYVFEGITNDGYYVLAEMYVSAGFLPEKSPDEFDGYKISYLYEDYKHPDEIKNRYKNYVAKITKRLESLPPDNFDPKLSEFEKIISSLKIEK